jgi:dipeptidyl-peptidase-4
MRSDLATTFTNVAMYSMKKIVTIILFFSIVIGKAQDKKLTIAEAVRGGYTTFYPKGLDQFQWLPNTNKFSQIITESGERKILIQEVDKTQNGATKTITLQDLNTAYKKLNDTLSLKSIPGFTWLDNNNLKFASNGELLSYHIGDKTCRVLCRYNSVEMEHAEFNPLNTAVAYVKEDNIYISTNQTTEDIKITADGGKGIVYGQAVHRNEFGINGGLFWSESGQKLAYYRMDEKMVSEYPLYNLKDRPATAKELRYPVAGAKSHHVHVAVYNTITDKTVFIKTGEPLDQYLTNITWSPDDKIIYIAIVNRAQNHMWLNSYNAETGDFIKTLFDEHNEKYVEPEHGLYFLKNDPTKFIWFSERDGYDHLYLFGADGVLIKQLTKGKWVVTDYLGTDSKAEMLYIVATAESALERHLYCVNMKNGKMQKISKDEGVHSFKANSDFSFFYDDFNNAITPRKVQILNEAGGVKEVLANSDNTLKDYKMAETTTGMLKANDGTPLYYRLYKPINFDPTKKYPVVVYLYNGPHLQLVTNNWMGGLNLWYHYMAQNGYAVFILDGRGSSNRGLNFENAVHGKLGTLEMSDQLKGVEFLKSQPWVDGNRLGIHGWSFGGFMTTTMMTRAAGTYKVGVAGGPVIDWGLYEIMYTERYMDTPEENPEGYKTANLLNYVDSLQGKLLMIHGAQDNVVLWQHSLLYVEEAIKKGKQMDYFVYPQHEHNVLGKDRIHLMEKVSNYFFDNL